MRTVEPTKSSRQPPATLLQSTTFEFSRRSFAIAILVLVFAASSIWTIALLAFLFLQASGFTNMVFALSVSVVLLSSGIIYLMTGQSPAVITSSLVNILTIPIQDLILRLERSFDK